MTKLFYLFICLSSLVSFSQVFEENTIYIFGRGSKSKQFLICNDFNINHQKLTHIAIGFLLNEELSIYEISIEGGENSRINKTNWDSFKSEENNYLSVWRYKCNSDVIVKLNSLIDKRIDSELSYNFSFDLNANNKEYCSQFVANVLNELNIFNFKPTTIKLKAKYRSILLKENLEYYPTDFFIPSQLFENIFERSKLDETVSN